LPEQLLALSPEQIAGITVIEQIASLIAREDDYWLYCQMQSSY
jgi:hypothetical protein